MIYLVLFGDTPSGEIFYEIFYMSVADLRDGGQDPMSRVLLNDGGDAKTPAGCRTVMVPCIPELGVP